MNLRRAVKDKLARRELVNALFPNHSSPGLAEFVSKLGFDFIVLDTEHGGPDIETVANMIRACHLANVPVIVRPWGKDAGLLRRYLDYGIDGFIVPDTESAADIRHFLKAIEDTAAPLWQDAIVIALIESVKGIDNLNEILAMKEVDGIVIGPGDLARSMQLPRHGENPSVREKVFMVCEAARKAGKSVGAPPFIYGVEDCMRAGSNLLTFSLNALIRQSAASLLAKVKQDFRP
jgi:2-keto-3-deoxy-L-rhamnonate aldolase RhmA